MKVDYLPSASQPWRKPLAEVRKAFFKQVRFLVADLKHQSLHAKKYHVTRAIGRARINRDWRFYFKIEGDTYVIHKLIPHPK